MIMILKKLGFYFFITLGITLFLQKFVKILQWLYKFFFLHKINFKEKYGDGWVLISGGSEGIGFSFAKKFLEFNYKVCLLSRNIEKLRKAKEDLLKCFPSSEIRVLSYDLNKSFTENDLLELNEKLNSLNGNISIFINNAGVVTRDILCNLTNDQIHSMINVNVIGMTFITRAVINIMLTRKQKSLIVSSGSVNGRMRIKTRSIYSSTKSYLEAFMETLQREYGNKIDFTCLNIGAVETSLNRVKMPLKVSADEFVNSSINYLGKYGFTTGHIKHELLNILFWEIPFVKEIYHYIGGSMK